MKDFFEFVVFTLIWILKLFSFLGGLYAFELMRDKIKKDTNKNKNK